MWRAAKDGKPAVSSEEQEVLDGRPGKDASEDDLAIWRMRLLRTRELFPTPPAFVYDGKIVSPATQLPAGTPIARGLSIWTQAVLPRMFKVDP